MVKTYDPASYDLAEHFLQEEKDETSSYKSRCHELALAIQQTVEDCCESAAEVIKPDNAEVVS
mgnify:CR=1 FL=1